MASKTNAKILRVLKPDDANFATEWNAACTRDSLSSQNIDGEVRAILERVREGKDRALRSCAEEFDGGAPNAFEVSPAEWDLGCESVDAGDRAAIGKSAMRVREYHRKRIPSSWEMREEGGAYMGQRVRPLNRVGIYVPGGESVHPSSVVMNTVPASVVEVPEIILATPPRPDGTVCPEVLIAARVAGIHRIFKLGGAHAIAAMAYGSETIPRVDKIVGGGGPWVSTAKRLVSGRVAVDSETGASEVCIVADRSATPAWLAADLISHAEQEESAYSILITHVKSIATKVVEQLARQLKTTERKQVASKALSKRGIVVLTKSLQDSIDLANEYAAEHLVLAVEDPDALHKRVINAGAVLLGHYTTVAAGDYLAGPNHVLPTGGSARFFSPLGVEDFLKRTAFIRFEPPKLRELGGEVTRLANVEGFSGHGRSIDLRLQKIRRARREREAAREAEAEL